MSAWDSTQGVVIRFPPEAIDGHPAWLRVDCGCCAGLEWGGDSPRECDTCRGVGFYAIHRPTGTMAMYPGGPLLGRDPNLIPDTVVAGAATPTETK